MGTLFMAALLGAVYLVAGLLTGVGQWRRTRVAGHVLLAAVVWPVAWAVWYHRDQRQATE